MILGTITTRHVLQCPLETIRAFGFVVFLRCLRASRSRRPTTFLALVHGLDA